MFLATPPFRPQGLRINLTGIAHLVPFFPAACSLFGMPGGLAFPWTFHTLKRPAAPLGF
jgi:hypothetical protein